MANTHRSTSLGTALRYRGREGMWTWILHRVTGLGILLFLLIHVVDTALVIYWPGLYEHALNIYKSAFFRFAELAIVFSVLYHALNGLRIVVQDFWPGAMLRQRQLVWAVAVLVVLTILPVAWLMLRPVFGLGPEPGAARFEAASAGTETTVQAPAHAAAGVRL
ncbi:MAG: sdhC [Gemmatimonadetes bacterium]|nr:sdhC [Gemmatimonadota bacterium]